MKLLEFEEVVEACYIEEKAQQAVQKDQSLSFSSRNSNVKHHCEAYNDEGDGDLQDNFFGLFDLTHLVTLGLCNDQIRTLYDACE